MARHKSQRYFQTDDGTPTAQENRVARKVDGKRQAGSGASDYAKGDVDAKEFLVECKKTEKGSLRVTKKWLNKISLEANGVQKWPALAIEIQGGPDEPMCDRDWVAIPARVFRKLTEGS